MSVYIRTMYWVGRTGSLEPRLNLLFDAELVHVNFLGNGIRVTRTTRTEDAGSDRKGEAHDLQA